MRFSIVRAGLAGAALAVAVPAAHADCPDPMADGYQDAANVGLFLGGSYGTGKVRFTYGLDVRLGTGSVVGLVRVEGQGFSHLKLVGGVNAVAPTSASAKALDGEVGVALRTGHADFGRSLGLHLGAGVIDRTEVGAFLRAGMFGTLALSGDRENQDYGAAGWLIVPPDLGACEVVVGRPLREGDRFLLPAASCAHLPRTRDGAAIAAYWIEAARGEASSVPSFVRLADELAAAGAPGALIAAARDAAGDEVRHARICGAMVGGVALAPMRRAPARAASSRAAALTRLAVEAWTEGCLGEGAAAAEAAAAARTARTSAARAAQRRIAADEARHAELSWQVLAWAWRAGSPAVRDAIVEAIETAPVPAPRAHAPGVDLDRLAWHGVPVGLPAEALQTAPVRRSLARRARLRLRTRSAS